MFYKQRPHLLTWALALFKAGLLSKEVDKIVQTTGIDSERVKQIIHEFSYS